MYTRPRGLFLSIDKPDSVEAALRGFGAQADDIDLIVASDAEEILGIGDFVDRYVQAARRVFPHALLHWEDFGSTNCRRILNRYRDSMPTFNDDMQGTGAIVMSGLFNALKVAGTTWVDQRVVVLGAGTAGTGIADQIRDQMVREGLDAGRATRQIWLVDLPGLLTEDMSGGLLDYQRPYARPADEVLELA